MRNWPNVRSHLEIISLAGGWLCK